VSLETIVSKQKWSENFSSFSSKYFEPSSLLGDENQRRKISHSSGLFESYYYNHLTWVRIAIEWEIKRRRRRNERKQKVTNSLNCIRMLS
jgi:hypothetical protein